MTYLAFHCIFILPPILALSWLQRGRIDCMHPRAGLFLGLMAAIAFVYTAPWDNYLVWRGVWGYGAERVVGTIGYVPVEEYLFFVLQPLLAGLWLYQLLPAGTAAAGRAARWVGAAIYGVLVLPGAILLRRPEGTYLGLILVWAAPVLALQWAYAGGELWARRRVWAAGITVPTLYLWAADAVAIRLGIWRISEVHTLGPALGPLPLEEAVFFLFTNLLVIQGLLLFLHPPNALRAATAKDPDLLFGSEASRRQSAGASLQRAATEDGAE
jgi:lycopene cyclase domain-containing protein